MSGILDIKNKIKNAIVGEGAGKVADLVTSISDGIAQFVDTPEKKADLAKFLEEAKAKAIAESNRHAEQVATLAISELEAHNANTASAREMNSKLQGEKPSWMARNVAYIIDLFLMILWGAVTIYILARMLNFIAKDDHVDFTGVLAMWGGITALATTVVNFHRGSSKTAETQAKQMSKMWDETP